MGKTKGLTKVAAKAQAKQRAREDRILGAWYAHDGDDISTERLLQMVSDDTGAEADEIATVIERAGLLKDDSLF